MNLIRNNNYVVTDTYLPHLSQFIFTPNTPDWIVRMAQQKKFIVGISSKFFKLVKINLIPTGSFYQVILHNFAVEIFFRSKKRWINRRLNNNTFSRLGKCLNSQPQAGYYSW